MKGPVCLLTEQNLFLFFLYLLLFLLTSLRNTQELDLPENQRIRQGQVEDDSSSVVGNSLIINFMELWHKMIFPVRRVWFTVSARLKARKNGAGILKLHNDVQTCEYQDVQVMWDMLIKSEIEVIAKRKQRPFWRVFAWSNHNEASSFSAQSV